MIGNERIESAIEIINCAIENNISVGDASVKCGKGYTYFKNTKREIKNQVETLPENLYLEFSDKLKFYNDLRTTATYVGSNPKLINNTLSLERDDFSKDKIPLNSTSIKEDEKGINISIVEGNAQRIKSLGDLLTQMNVDTKQWDIKGHIVNTWETAAVIDGEWSPHTNYQVKARLEKYKQVKDAETFADAFKRLIEGYTPPKVSADIVQGINNDPMSDNLLEISLFDLHIGKLGWSGEVGENYDSGIARKRFIGTIETLLRQATGFGYKEILFPIGNDFFNSDNQFNTTTKGTPQDEDGRWQKTFNLGHTLITDAVTILKATGVPVKVIVIPGNHDQERSFYLGEVVSAFFKDDNQVDVNNSAMTRKYIKWGEVLLGFTHGNEEKENALPMLMAKEAKQEWCDSRYHEWHLGHFHKKKTSKYTILDKSIVMNEEFGVIVRYLSSLSGTEEWHYKKGYVGSHKAGEAFVWNKRFGMLGHLNANWIISGDEL